MYYFAVAAQANSANIKKVCFLAPDSSYSLICSFLLYLCCSRVIEHFYI